MAKAINFSSMLCLYELTCKSPGKLWSHAHTGAAQDLTIEVLFEARILDIRQFAGGLVVTDGEEGSCPELVMPVINFVFSDWIDSGW